MKMNKLELSTKGICPCCNEIHPVCLIGMTYVMVAHDMPKICGSERCPGSYLENLVLVG